MLLTTAEAAAIESRVARLEAERGVEVVTLLARKADDYPEAVWKAFAFGAEHQGSLLGPSDAFQRRFGLAVETDPHEA